MGQMSFFDLQSQGKSLAEIQQACLDCRLCRLSQSRDRVVFGAGDPVADIMLIGQGPSQTDNGTGLPYSGPSGTVLDKALAEVGLSRAKIWLTNLHKCLAYDPKNHKIRPPRADEVTACQPWLQAEIRLVQPKVLVCIGGPAAKAIIGPSFKLSEQRGRWYQSKFGIQAMATLQPAYLMRLKEWDRAQALTSWRELVADLGEAVRTAQAG